MFKGMKDMGQLLKQANEMKKKLKDMQDNLKSMIITHQHNGVHVQMNGEMDILKLELSPDFMTKFNTQTGATAIKEAVNQAIKQAKSQAASQLNAITGGLNIPGLPGM